MAAGAIRNQIECLLKYLEPFSLFANSHMVDFFTNSLYTSSIPLSIQAEVQAFGHDKIIEFILKNTLNEVPNLKRFIDHSEKLTLGNCSDTCKTRDEFLGDLQGKGANIDGFKLEIFMNPKKSHEVEILGTITGSLYHLSHLSHLIDLGDGKGYLSSFLALRYGIPILGVDCSSSNTSSAEKRAEKLSKIWNGISKAPLKSRPGANENFTSDNVRFYKRCTQFVDVDFNLAALIADTFPVDAALRIGLVGLHTCGDLAADSLRLFVKNPDVKMLCNVGCCYHLLTEDEVNVGFPLSSYLRQKSVQIGRNARMIANLSVDRILTEKSLPNVTIFYRALLQVLLRRHCEITPTKHVGKFRKQPRDFVEYCREAIRRIEVEINVSDEEIQGLYESYKGRIGELNIYYLLRSKLAPIIENLILLDRLLFLKEQGVESSYLVQIFNPVLSPRCYGIIALKE